MTNKFHIWMVSYIGQCIKRKPAYPRPMHIIFTLVDHFEPRWGRVGIEKELERVDRWISKYEPVASRHRDCDGKTPQYSFFYPIDEYTPQAFEKVVRFCKNGFGEIEVHLHHDGDNEESLRKKLEHAKDVFGGHGLLGREKTTGAVKYGFVHGNWSLGNSRRDGKWCGVNNELSVLKETGCYADFTMPSAPSETQPQKINSIYYAKDNGAPKPHNTGRDAEAGNMQAGGLMLIQGPLALNWAKMKIENGGITMENPPLNDRVDLWVRQGIGVKGRPDWVFVKVYTHGVQDNNLKDAYFKNLDKMFCYLEEKYNDGTEYKLHYTTAREMYNIVKSAEAGESGEPGMYRDYEISIKL